MKSLSQVKENLKALNKRNKELINIINEITGSVDATITKGIDTFETVLENAMPVLTEKEFTENGTYTPDEGYDGFNNVIVNVSMSEKISKPICSKTSVIYGLKYCGDNVETTFFSQESYASVYGSTSVNGLKYFGENENVIINSLESYAQAK